MTMNPVLSLNLRKSFSGFELSVNADLPGGIAAVFGPSGSGKTTLLNCIAGLERPDDGEIRLQDRILYSKVAGVNLAPERRRVGYMFQESLLFPHLNVEENILYGYNLTPDSRRMVDPAQLVELLELRPLMQRRTAGLSTGEQQRVALARALASSPNLLLLDEPLAALHVSIRGRILRYLKAIRRELSIPMVYVSHSISEIMALADSALVLDKGRQVAMDEPRSLLGQSAAAPLIARESVENIFDVNSHGTSAGKRNYPGRPGRDRLGPPPDRHAGGPARVCLHQGFRRYSRFRAPPKNKRPQHPGSAG